MSPSLMISQPLQFFQKERVVGKARWVLLHGLLTIPPAPSRCTGACCSHPASRVSFPKPCPGLLRAGLGMGAGSSPAGDAGACVLPPPPVSHPTHPSHAPPISLKTPTRPPGPSPVPVACASLSGKLSEPWEQGRHLPPPSLPSVPLALRLLATWDIGKGPKR